MTDLFTIKTDRTSDIIIEYIKYLDKNNDINRILGDTYKFVNVEIDDTNQNVSIGKSNDDYIIVNPKSAYLRRDVIKFAAHFKENMYNEKINKHITKEIEFLRDFVYSYALKIGDLHRELYNNKLINLLIAKKCGINIPPTLVTTSKLALKKFIDKYFKIITKPINNGHLNFNDKEFAYSSKGLLFIKDEEIKKISNQFCVSLFQAYIEKEVELRIFYLNERVYPMAIFSQFDEQTKYDFRNYNHIKPNRNVPFKLPKSLENKIHKFMKTIGLKTGSIDVILTPKNEYYFLEVNPTGQFGWVSRNCNYYLEKEIAKNLIEDET